MSTVESIDSLHATLEPLEALRGEHNQLEEWVNDSFLALEKLHEDLSIWQSELARKQTEIDLREDSLDKCQQQGAHLDEDVAQWKHDLEEAREEVRQLDEENVEQLQALEDLEVRYAELQQELDAAQERRNELADTLAKERARAADDQNRWKDEFRQLRRLLEEQRTLPTQQPESNAGADECVETCPDATVDAPSRSAELRRRAEARRAARRRKQQDSEESSD